MVPYPPITITADSYEAAVDQFQQFFAASLWSDGLALIPPTRAAVDYMLTGTSRSRDEVLGKIPVKNGICTIEKIAINAVMAGASPEHLPVIIAVEQALANPEMEDVHPQASLSGSGPIIWVSGPIVEELNMGSERSMYTYGNRPNNVIGRAVHLCQINLGQMWPGLNDMAQKRDYPWTLLVIGEDYHGNPWAPYQVSQGYKAEDSCVTTSIFYRGETVYAGSTAKDKLDAMVKEILSKRSGMFTLYDPNTAIPGQGVIKMVFAVTPELAQAWADMGYTTEQKLLDYIYQATSIPYEQLTADEITRIQARIDKSIGVLGSLGYLIEKENIPAFQAAFKPGGKVPLLFEPGNISIVVCGGQGQAVQSWAFGRGVYTWTSQMTYKITGATKTKNGH